MGTDANSDECEESYFMRVWVGIDITKPFCRGRNIVLRSGGENWVNFKHEQLPNVCY